MRMCTGQADGCHTICPGIFLGGEIEPGTFHESSEALGRAGQSSASEETRSAEAGEKPPVDNGPVEQDASEQSE